MTYEQVLYEDHEVRITNTVVQTRGGTYPVRQIAGVRATKDEPGMPGFLSKLIGGLFLFAGIGLFLAMLDPQAKATETVGAGVVVTVIGALLIRHGYVSAREAKPWCVVMISTSAGGWVPIVATNDEERGLRVANTLRQMVNH